MKINSSPRKSIAAIPTGFKGQERRYAQSVSEAVDTLSGRRGNLIDRAVTFRDLLDTGVLRLAGGILGGGSVDVINPNDPNGPDSGPTELPTKPINLAATQLGFDIINLTWGLPPYSGHNYIEIFRYASNDIVAAEAAGAYTRYYGDTYFYTDTNVGSSETWYYWVRAVNVDGITGPFNDSSGASGSTAQDYVYVSGLIDSILGDAVSGLGLNTTLEGQQSEIDLTNTKFSVKIDDNGHVAGFGLISTSNTHPITGVSNPTSAFIVAADQFAIASDYNSNSTDNNSVGTNYPFKVLTQDTYLYRDGAWVLDADGGYILIPAGVYIDDAFIHEAQITSASIGEATITDGHIENLTATKITTGNIQITASNDIKIYQGKTTFNSNTSGFWLGLNNSAGSFHVGAGAKSFLKFDGSTGRIEATGLTIKAQDGTTLLRSGGMTAGGNNLVYNSNFSKGVPTLNANTGIWSLSSFDCDGWFSYSGSAGLQRPNEPYIMVYGNNYFRSTAQRFPVTAGETIYLNCQTQTQTGVFLAVQFYNNQDGENDGGNTAGRSITASTGTIDFDTRTGQGNTNRAFGVGKITVPDGFEFAELRFGSNVFNQSIYFYEVGASRVPTEISPDYASTFIRNLSVNTLQIAGNAVTVPLGDSDDPDSAFTANEMFTNRNSTFFNAPYNSSNNWKNGVDVGPLTWDNSDINTRPQAVTVICNAVIQGTSSTDFSLRMMQILVANNAGFTSNVQRFGGTDAFTAQENRQQDDTSLMLNVTQTLADLNMSSPLFFKIQVSNTDDDSSPHGRLRNNGISVLASKK